MSLQPRAIDPCLTERISQRSQACPQGCQSSQGRIAKKLSAVSNGKPMKKALTKNQINALSEYLTILRRKYRHKIVDVLLFGSVARGEYDEESDIDILVVVENGEAKFRDEISMASYEPMLRNDVVISALAMDEIMYNWHRKYRDPLYKVIEREGINLWKKPPKFLSVSD